MTILGLNAFHGDSAACLVRDGKLIAAAEEERFRRIKHWAGLPIESIKYCLRESSLSFSDLDHIAFNRKPGVNNLRRLLFVLRYRPHPGLITNRVQNIRAAGSIEDRLRSAFPSDTFHARVHPIEHHLAHLASAFSVSPFDHAVCLSIDGFGDFASAAWGLGRATAIHVDGRVYFPHSLGIFYSAITQFLGFPHFGDEYKVMGLAPYGAPRYLPQMRRIVRIQPDSTYRLDLRYFHHHTNNVSYTWNHCAPQVGSLYTPALEDLLGPARKPNEPLDQNHKDLARSAQAIYEECFFALLNALHAKYQCPNLALSGGCAMNSVANGKILLHTPFRQLYVPPSPGDAGGAIGAAFVVWNNLRARSFTISQRTAPVSARPVAAHHQIFPLSPSDAERAGARGTGHFVMAHAYTGPAFDDAAITDLLQSRGLLKLQPATCNFQLSTCNLQPPLPEFQISAYPDPALLCRATAQAIADGLVVGWFQGRMEWGPRALGNRSILCDPRRSDMKQILNAKIKRRESFRPFAPSILRQRVAEWFEQDDDVPFMMQVFQVRSNKRALVPAITHVDGSGRLQTVHRETNPLYHLLISTFESLTSIPILLNTSFNENEPIVCRPEEALDCFLRTKMDVLVLGSFFVERRREREERRKHA